MTNHDWPHKRIEEISKEIFAGGDVPKQACSKFRTSEYTVPVYTNGIVNEGLYGYTNIERVKEPSLTISARGTIGAVFKRLASFYPAIRLISITPTEQVSIDFLYHALSALHFKNEGVTIPQLTVPTLKSIKIPVPTMSVQNSITAELDSIKKLICLKEKQLKECDELLSTLFYEYFGDPIYNEKNWPMKALSSLSNRIANGCNAKLEEGTYKSHGFPFFRCQNVWRNHFDWSDMVYIDEETNESMKSSSLHHNDLLITKIGRINTENSSLGRVSLYEGESLKANLSGNLSYIRLKDGVNPKFILYILISESYRDYIRRTTPGGIDKRALNNTQIGEFPIILPPSTLQDEFTKRASMIERKKKSVTSTLDQLQELLASRMQYWFD